MQQGCHYYELGNLNYHEKKQTKKGVIHNQPRTHLADEVPAWGDGVGGDGVVLPLDGHLGGLRRRGDKEGYVVVID